MFTVTIDVYSGRPNPSYVIGRDEAAEVLRGIPSAAMAHPSTRFDGLGFRGVIVVAHTDDPASAGFKLPSRFVLGGGAADDEDAGLEAAQKLIRGVAGHQPLNAAVPTDDEIGALVNLARQRGPSAAVPDSLPSVPVVPPSADLDTGSTCSIERSKFNPAFWNDDPNVRAHNNCYNYASDWRTDNFAQPGLGGGQPAPWPPTCEGVGAALLADGCHHRFDGFPDSEAPRRLIALVIAPGQDFHFYRIASAVEGFWGHKPGQMPARNYDNSGQLITSPETCNRGNYTQFCGYFYTCETQAQRITGSPPVLVHADDVASVG